MKNQPLYKPWDLLKVDSTKNLADTTVNFSLNIAALICVLIAPFLPNVADAMATQLNLDLRGATKSATRFCLLDPGRPFVRQINAGHRIGTPAPIFARIDQPTVDKLRKQFSGIEETPKKPKKHPKQHEKRKEV